MRAAQKLQILCESSTIWEILKRVNVLPHMQLEKMSIFCEEIFSTSASKADKFPFSQLNTCLSRNSEIVSHS